MKEGSICNKCNHRAYCAMGDEHNNDNATIKGCYLYSEQKAKTNADHIRSMTDEELADFLAIKIFSLPPCHLTSESYWEVPPVCKGCEGCWLDWLTQEVQQ